MIPESVPLCWSISFFVVDLLDAVVRREGMWIAHAVISLALNLLTGCRARHRAVRSVSKGFFAEGSTVRLLVGYCCCLGVALYRIGFVFSCLFYI